LNAVTKRALVLFQHGLAFHAPVERPARSKSMGCQMSDATNQCPLSG